MILASIIVSRIEIKLRRYGRLVARHPAVIDKGPWALREIGDRAGWLRISRERIKASVYIAALACSIAIFLTAVMP